MKVIGEVQDKDNVTLECTTNAIDLTFSFRSTVEKGSISNLAECVFKLPHCVFFDSTSLSMYSIFQTNHGGLLTILNLSAKQYGIYKCFETFRPESNDYIAIPREEKDDVSNDKQTSDVLKVILGVSVSGFMCIVIIIIIIMCRRRRNKSRGTGTQGGMRVHKDPDDTTNERTDSDEEHADQTLIKQDDTGCQQLHEQTGVGEKLLPYSDGDQEHGQRKGTDTFFNQASKTTEKPIIDEEPYSDKDNTESASSLSMENDRTVSDKEQVMVQTGTDQYDTGDHQLDEPKGANKRLLTHPDATDGDGKWVQREETENFVKQAPVALKLSNIDELPDSDKNNLESTSRVDENQDDAHIENITTEEADHDDNGFEVTNTINEENRLNAVDTHDASDNDSTLRVPQPDAREMSFVLRQISDSPDGTETNQQAAGSAGTQYQQMSTKTLYHSRGIISKECL